MFCRKSFADALDKSLNFVYFLISLMFHKLDTLMTLNKLF